MTNDKEKAFDDRIMDEISKRRLGIRPKWYFTLLTIVFGAVLLLVWVTTVTFLSIGLFRVRHINPLNYLHFGNAGWLISLKLIPWELVVFALLGLLVTWLLVRRFDFSYKIRFGLLAFILVAGAVVASLVLDRNKFGEQVEKSGIVPLLVRHESFGTNWVEGKIEAISNNGFEIKTHKGKEVSVLFGTKVKTQGKNLIKENKTVRIIGGWLGKNFVANIVEVEERDKGGD